MRFGGHQTFAIREGWLFKGLRMLFEEPDRFMADDLADWLGVGRNMAKSIHHWLLASGLARPAAATSARSKALVPTGLAETIWKHDRYLLHPGTWWVVHIELVHHPRHAYAWSWFFNHFSSARFEKPVAIDALQRYLTNQNQRLPSSRTLDREIACLLRSYAVSLPRERTDPEDALECPLSELGLLVHSRQTGFYHLNRERKPVPFEIFAYAVARSRIQTGSESQNLLDLSLSELTHSMNAPGRIFALTAEALYDLVAAYETENTGIRLDGQAGDRVVRVNALASLEWLNRYYAHAATGRGETAA